MSTSTQVITKNLLIEGTSITVAVGQVTRGKDATIKGRPLYAWHTAAPVPNLNEFTSISKALGQDNVLKLLSGEVQEIFKEAAKLSWTQLPDGNWTIDDGKFQVNARKLAAAATAEKAKKAELDAELAAISEQNNKASGELMELIGKGLTKASPEMQACMNRLMQIQLKYETLKAQLDKSSGRGKKKATAVAATPAAA